VVCLFCHPVVRATVGEKERERAREREKERERKRERKRERQREYVRDKKKRGTSVLIPVPILYV